MKFNYEGFSKKPVIYMIYNNCTHGIYIGQTSECKNRWVQGYQKSLVVGKCHNKHLQNSFTKYYQKLGHTEFLQFHVLRAMEGSTQTEREIVETQLIKFFEGIGYEIYNSHMQTVTKQGRSTFSNTPAETHELISKTQKRLWKDPVERQKRIEGSDGTRREKIGKASSEMWASMSPEASQAIAEKRQKLSTDSWNDPTIREKRMAGLTANSWKVSKAHKQLAQDPVHRARLAAQGQAMAKTYEMVDPAGNRVSIHNMTKFCRENGLCKQNMLKAAKGINTSCKGWKRYGITSEELLNIQTMQSIRNDKHAKTYEMLNPEGKIVMIHNMSKFCKEKGLCCGNMINVIAGRVNSHKGWKKP